jgi:NTE family protein
MPTIRKTGLSLSGGGYRATAFHLGTLRKLEAMGILQHVDIISTISGGSIAGAYYALHRNNFREFSESLYEALLSKNVIRGVIFSWTFLQLIIFVALFAVPATWLLFSPYAWLSPIVVVLFFIVILRFQFQIFPVSKRVEKLYDNYFYKKAKLCDLPDNPKLVIGSTNLQTARAFTFSKTWMQDTTYEYLSPKITFEASEFPLARAVMASSCVPFAFTPISIDKKYFSRGEDANRIHPVLVDGGVYDNQGIHKIIQLGRYACDVVITSDAGGGSSGELTFKNTIALLLTTVEVFMARIRKVQMVKDVYANVDGANRQVAYFSLSWDAEHCIPGFIDNLLSKQVTASVIEAHELLPQCVADPKRYEVQVRNHLEIRTGYASINRPTQNEKKIARKVGTNLTSLSKQQLDCLIKQAEALTELQVRLYCPILIPTAIKPRPA